MMKEKLYLSEYMKKYNIEAKKGYLNLIKAPCGSGKTTYIFKDLLEKSCKYRVIYLVDTKMLFDCLNNQYPKDLKSVSKGCFEMAMFGLNKTDEDYDRNNRALIMTYSTFGTLIQNEAVKRIIDIHFDLVVMDEFHNLFNYAERYDSQEKGLYINVINYLSRLCSNTKVIAMTATPWKYYNNDFIDSYREKLYTYDIVGNNYSMLRRYTENITRQVVHIENVIKFLNKDKILESKSDFKVLVYTKKIKRMKILEKMFIDKGYNVGCLWSINSKTKLDEKQIELRNYIIENQMLPNSINVLIINGGYETGFDIKDTSVKTVICDSKNIDEITQVRNRIRGDIQVLIRRYFTSELDKEENQNMINNEFNNKLIIDIKYIGVELTKEYKKELVEKYATKTIDAKCNWQTFKSDIENSEEYVLTTNKKKKFVLYTKEMYEYNKQIEQEDKIVKNTYDKNEFIEYIDKVAGSKLYQNQQVELKNHFMKYGLNDKTMGINTLNGKLLDKKLPYLIKAEKESYREDGKVKSRRYWRIYKIV